MSKEFFSIFLVVVVHPYVSCDIVLENSKCEPVNKRRLKPEYDFIERGKPPKGTFICKLTIESFDYVAETEARTKREAQPGI